MLQMSWELSSECNQFYGECYKFQIQDSIWIPDHVTKNCFTVKICDIYYKIGNICQKIVTFTKKFTTFNSVHKTMTQTYEVFEYLLLHGI